jgi:hypothetical protein
VPIESHGHVDEAEKQLFELWGKPAFGPMSGDIAKQITAELGPRPVDPPAVTAHDIGTDPWEPGRSWDQRAVARGRALRAIGTVTTTDSIGKPLGTPCRLCKATGTVLVDGNCWPRCGI